MKPTVLGPAVVLIAVAVNHADDTKDSRLIRGTLSPIMQRLHHQYAKKGLFVIGASIETEAENKEIKSDLDKYAHEHKYNYKMLFRADAPAEACRIPGIPTILIVDRKGIIRRVHVGLRDDEDLLSELDKMIKTLLAEVVSDARP